MRDIESPLVWAYSFLAYAAIRTSDPSTRNLPTYGRLLIREAQHHMVVLAGLSMTKCFVNKLHWMGLSDGTNSTLSCLHPQS